MKWGSDMTSGGWFTPCCTMPSQTTVHVHLLSTHSQYFIPNPSKKRHWELQLLSKLLTLQERELFLCPSMSSICWLLWQTGHRGVVFTFNTTSASFHNHWQNNQSALSPSPPLPPSILELLIMRSCHSNRFKQHLLQHRRGYRTSYLNVSVAFVE